MSHLLVIHKWRKCRNVRVLLVQVGGGGVSALLDEQGWPLPWCCMLLMCLSENIFVLQILDSSDWIRARALLSSDIFQPSHFAGTLKGNSDVHIRLPVNRSVSGWHAALHCTHQLLMWPRHRAAEWHTRARLKFSAWQQELLQQGTGPPPEEPGFWDSVAGFKYGKIQIQTKTRARKGFAAPPSLTLQHHLNSIRRCHFD